MGACGHAAGGVFGCEDSAKGEAAADAFGDHHDVRAHAGPFMGKEFAGPRDAALHFVQHHQSAGFVAQRADALETDIGQRADAALALHRLNQDPGHIGLLHCLFDRVVIPKGQMTETGQQGREAFGHLLAASGGDTGRGAAMEAAVESYDHMPFRLAFVVPVLARHLDRQLAAFGTRVGEKHGVGKGGIDQLVRQLLLLRDLVEVRHMPQVLGLGGQRLGQGRVGVAKGVYRDPRTEVEKTSAVSLDQPAAFAFDEG